MNTNKRGRPALPEGEKKVMFSRRLKPWEIEVVTAALKNSKNGTVVTIQRQGVDIVSPGVVKSGEVVKLEAYNKGLGGDVDKLSKELEKCRVNLSKSIESEERVMHEAAGLRTRLNDYLDNPEGEGAAYWKFKYEDLKKVVAERENDGSS